MASVEVSKGLSVEGPSALHGGVSLAQLKVRAGKTIALPSGASAFVTVSDDGAEEANELTVDAPADGQLLVVCNHDAQPLSGVAAVPYRSCAMLVHDFESMSWSRVDAPPPAAPEEAAGAAGEGEASTPPPLEVAELKGVTALHAAGDLSIGDAHTFAAGRLQVRGVLPVVSFSMPPFVLPV